MFCNRNIFVVILVVLFAVSVNSTCTAPSADDCLSEANVTQLPSKTDLTSYCPAAAALANDVTECLTECNFSATSSVQNFLSSVDSDCAAPGCQKVISIYSGFASCFDKYGGLQTVLNQIISAFNSKQITDQLCRYLAYGRNCQKSSISSCVYFRDLIQLTYRQFPLLAYAQQICGSENVPDITNEGACNRSEEMISGIEEECNIACSISSTVDPNTICLLLQDQVNCILRNSEGCTAIEKRFLLPRLNTYSIANTLLECPTPIQVRGITVQPTGLSPDYPQAFHCKYVLQINECFRLSLTDSVRTDVLERLLNGNLLLDQFCELQENGSLPRDQLVSSCEDSFLRCRLPVAEVYERPSTYESNYNISLGPFLLGPWGLNTVLETLTCPNPTPPTLCQKYFSSGNPSIQALRPTPAVTRRPTPVRRLNTPTMRQRN